MASTGEVWKLGHRPALDGVRGIAILLVIASHFDHRYSSGGPVGVTVFFVLSGFLITALLLEERDRTGCVSLGGFYLRRARRLFPALGLLVLVVGTLQTALGVPVSALVPVVFYVGNWAAIAGEPMGFFKHTWSLSVEEQFYLVWPLVLLAALRLWGRRGVLAAAILGAVASVLLRFAIWDGGAGAVHARFGSDANAAGLLIGCALAAWMHGRPVTGRNRPALAGLVVTIPALVAASPSLVNYTLVAPLVAMAATPVAVWLLVRGGGVGWFGNPLLRFIGRRSYGYYLWHAPLLTFAVVTMGGHSAASVAVATLFTATVAEVSWRFVERPLLGHSQGQETVPEVIETVPPDVIETVLRFSSAPDVPTVPSNCAVPAEFAARK